MLDVAYLRDHQDEVKANSIARGVRNAMVDEAVAADDERRRLQRTFDELKADQNQLSEQFKKAGKDADLRERLQTQSRGMKDRLAALDTEVAVAQDQVRAALMTIPNLTHPDAPRGAEAADNKVVARYREPTKFEFKPKDHVDLIQSLDLADLEAGTKVTGPKFYFLKNEGALLELALVQYAITTLVKEGFTPVITPDLAKTSIMEGTGYMPRDPDPNNRQFYQIADSDLCLIATAEITIGGMHQDTIFDEAELPKKYAGLSHCFRTEAGAAGRDTRGLYRVHQFTKVEMFAFTTPEQSNAMHEELRAVEEKLFQGLGLPYHVIDTCTGDLGGPAYRKYDLEAWMPGRGTSGDYGEVTSTSNCTDYQARRLNIRYKSTEKKRNAFVHTLNGTAVACTRALVAILENYQQADGSVVVPEALRPWVGVEVIRPRRG